MAWIYLVVSPETPSHSETTSAPSLTANKTDTLKLSSYHEWLTAAFPQHLSGTTSPACGENTSTSPSTSSSQDSPARTSALRDAVKAWKDSEVDFSSRYLGLSTKSNRRSSSWKTSRQLGPAEVNEWSKNWPVAGMTVDGILFPLSTWARRIKEKDGFCWPTIRASDGEKGGPNQRFSAGGMTLPAAARMWPTPNARDWKGPPGKGCQERGGHQSSLPAATQQAGMGGQLNPTWTEWLMDFPIGWTELSDLGMQWYPRKRGKRLKD